jgi:hypothetical protein
MEAIQRYVSYSNGDLASSPSFGKSEARTRRRAACHCECLLFCSASVARLTAMSAARASAACTCRHHSDGRRIRFRVRICINHALDYGGIVSPQCRADPIGAAQLFKDE